MPALKPITVDDYTPFAQDTTSQLVLTLLMSLLDVDDKDNKPSIQLAFIGKTDLALVVKFLKTQGYKLKAITNTEANEAVFEVGIAVDSLGTYVNLVNDLLFLYRINEVDKAFRTNCEYDWKYELKELKYTVNSQSESITGVSLSELISSDGSHSHTCKLDMTARKSYIVELFELD